MSNSSILVLSFCIATVLCLAPAVVRDVPVASHIYLGVSAPGYLLGTALFGQGHDIRNALGLLVTEWIYFVALSSAVLFAYRRQRGRGARTEQ